LAPDAVAKTFTGVLDSLDKHTAEMILKTVLDDVTHNFDQIG
jgi:hypothetical protein